jgi:hypothetical protein
MRRLASSTSCWSVRAAAASPSARKLFGEVVLGGEGVGVVVAEDAPVRAVAALALGEGSRSAAVVTRPTAGVRVDQQHRIPQPQPRRTSRLDTIPGQSAGVRQNGHDLAVARYVGPRHPVDNGEGCGAETLAEHVGIADWHELAGGRGREGVHNHRALATVGLDAP